MLGQEAVVDRAGRAPATELRARVPGVAAEVTARVAGEVPSLAGSPFLEALLEGLVGYLAGLMDDPDRPAQGLLALAERAGAAEAAEGRGPDLLRGALRLGAGVAFARLADRDGEPGAPAAVPEVGRLAEGVVAVTGRIEEAVAAGYAGAVSGDEERRRALVGLLTAPDADEGEIRGLARRAGWRPSDRVAAVAVRPRRPGAPRPELPPGALLGLHLDPTCVIMPDPDGPGRRQRLTDGLDGWDAVIGPVVGLAGCGRSLRWAARVMELMAAGRIPARPLVDAVDHLPLLVLDREPELVDLVAADRLAPLDAVRPALRRELEATLLALMECHFRASVVAERMYVHPQTIRYRQRRLEELFGDALYDPGHQLELHMLLHARGVGARHTS